MKLLAESTSWVQTVKLGFYDLKKWLRHIWTMIQPVPLSTVNHLRIVPKSHSLCVSSLIPLTKPIVCKSDLSDQVAQVLAFLDVQVIATPEDFIRHCDLNNYIFDSSPHGINKSLEKVGERVEKLAKKFNTTVDPTHCQALCAAVDPYNIPEATKQLLSQLSLFACKDTKDATVISSISNCNKVCPLDSKFPVSFPEPIIIPRDVVDIRLAEGLGACLLTEEELCKVALRKFDQYKHKSQQELTRYILDSPVLRNSKELRELLRDIPFVVTRPTGKVIRPCEVYDPESNYIDAILGKGLTPAKAYWKYLDTLRGLGIKKVENMSLQDIVEHVEHVRDFKPQDDQTKKVVALLKLINIQENCQEICDKLLNIKFLCGIRDRPAKYPKNLNWESSRKPLYMPTQMKSYGKFKDVLGSVCSLVHCDEIPNVVTAFGWDEEPALQSVFKHLLNIRKFTTSEPLSTWHKNMCHQIYGYLDNVASQAIEDCNTQCLNNIQEYREHDIFLTKCGFKKPRDFAISKDCPPDLFSTESEGLWKYRKLITALDIKSHFHPSSLLEVINQKGKESCTGSLNNEEVHQVSRLLHLLFAEMSEVDLDSDFEEALKSTLLPATNGHLYPAYKLCVDDHLHIEGEELEVVHPSLCLSKEMIVRLYIQSKSLKRIKNSETRIPFELFGQREPLTTRLKNILKDYPCDSGIMKELVQNADDAEATKVFFIKDRRNHSTEKLLHKSLEPLQGPALCVYNDSCFKKKDLENIQRLGDCNKLWDAASIGEHGIGFNAVYHLTDAPSFISRGSKVPHREVLCMFDPRCKYYPDATEKFPGVMLRNLPMLREDHPDTFCGYLEKKLLAQGTVFRLPLRTSIESPISNKVVTMEDLDKITNHPNFKNDMKNALLFLKNVQEISVQTIQENGEWTTEYVAQSKIRDKSNLTKSSSMWKEFRQKKCKSYEYHSKFVEYNMDILFTDNGKG